MKAVLPALVRADLEPRLPGGLEACWFSDHGEATAAIGEAEIAWIDMLAGDMNEILGRAGRLKWLFTMGAGVERFDLSLLARIGAVLTNGSGLTSSAVAEYAVLGMLAAAKRYDQVVRMTDRRTWTDIPPGCAELEGSRALMIGMGAIGAAIAQRLAGFDVAVTGVTRGGRDGTLTTDQWRARLGEFDWVVLAPPTTDATRAMIGPAELDVMRPTAWLVNMGRGDLVDQPALIAALHARRIGGAVLDTVTPEPLPPDDPLWSVENCLITMHLSGRSQSRLIGRAVDRFVENLEAFAAGRPMDHLVDPTTGY